MQPELRHLRYFVAVTEELNFTRAAERLNISQQALSAAISQLEDQIGVRLLDRTTRRVELTPAAEAFLPEVKTTLNRLGRAVAVARSHAEGREGLLRVSYTNAGRSEIPPRTVRAFRAQFPSVQLDLRRGSTAEQIAQLVDEEIDVAFVRPPLYESSEISWQRLCEDEIVVALPERHLLSSGAMLSRSALREESFVLFPRDRGPGLYDHVVRHLWRAESPRIAAVEPDEEAMLESVAAGIGMSMIFSSTARQTAIAGVVFRPLEPALVAPLAVAWRRGEPHTLVGRFVRTTEAVADEQASDDFVPS